MLLRLLVAGIVLFSQRSNANSVDIDLIWNACTNPESKIQYCHTLNNYKDRQIEILETFFNQHTTNWQRNTLTVIYYGISQKFIIEHKFDKGPKAALFFKRDEYKVIFTWDL